MNRRFKNALWYGIPLLALAYIFYRTYIHLKPLAQKQSITTYQFYDLVIKVIAALLTLSAVVVALFKDSLLSLFKYVDFKITNRDQDFIAETMGLGSPPLLADSYKTFLKIGNEGNIVAEACAIKVIEIRFTHHNSGVSKPINVFDSIPIKWNNDKEEVNIHPDSHYLVSIISLSINEIPTVPGKDQGQNSVLSIGGIPISKDYTNGKLEAIFQLVCKNHKGIKYNITVVWNGEWRSRLSDIKEFYTVSNIKSKKKQLWKREDKSKS
jgi:hypothetical protein